MPLHLSGQTMQIGLNHNKNVYAYTVSVRQGTYLLECDGEKYGEYKRNNIFYINREGNKIEIRDKNSLIGSFDKISLIQEDKNCVFTLTGIDPKIKSFEYNDGITFRLYENNLLAVNYIDLEKYIAGVIEAEGGINAHPEYYKSQAILIRTYTIKNIYKHVEDEFNLCNEVHCQAYHGRNARNNEIYNATKATAGMVLIDKDSVLIMSPFHSSCGGQTSRAGIYWQKDLPYLQSINDPFCTDLRNSVWEKTIKAHEWYSYLKSMGISNPLNYTSKQAPNRSKYFISNPHKVTYRQIREKFGLRSSFFFIEKQNQQIVFKGRGYGHGIGMCQIGAMEMAKVGYTYPDIIHFYFHNVQITDYRDMELHRY